MTNPVSGSHDPVVVLAGALTGTEAAQVADRLAGRASRSQVLQVLPPARRGELRPLLEATRGIPSEEIIRGLHCAAAARADRSRVDLVWTAPQDLITTGGLTSSLRHLVDGARSSVVCATYNFQRSSAQWEALSEASARPDLDVRVYVDSGAADARPDRRTPTTQQVSDELRGATVLRTRPWRGRPTRTHAKFFVVDQRVLVVTSANFSWSGEQHNVELGVRVEDSALAEAAVRQMRALEEHVYEPVRRSSGSNA